MAAERHVKLFKNGRQSGSLVNSSFLLIAAQTLALVTPSSRQREGVRADQRSSSRELAAPQLKSVSRPLERRGTRSARRLAEFRAFQWQVAAV